jgi:peptidoglycan/LPS O-acetylase OafA/YrhL
MRHAPIHLDIEDTLALKGIAILAIALHNYFHFLLPVRENEFNFDPARFRAFLEVARDPHQTLPAAFAFLGHYGVQIFIFLSAYGLAVRYWDAPLSWTGFMWSRIKKIYPMFLLAILAWVVFVALLDPDWNALRLIRTNAASLVLTLLGVQNLVPGYELPPVGPWWFLPFIMQVYCLWPVLRRFTQRFGAAGLLTLSLASVALIYVANDALTSRWSINLLETPLGHIPELCLGIAAARYGVFPGRIAAAGALALLAAASGFGALWPWGAISALVLALGLYTVARPWLRHTRWLRYVGTCSMALFLVNGFTRLPFLALASRWDTRLAGSLLGLLSVCFAVTTAQLLSTSEALLRRAAAIPGATNK